jgi:predicted CopG family antitoxin
MSTTIRVSDDTKSLLSVLKEDDESWDEFLSRLARRERDVDELGGFADEGVVEDMEAAREQARDEWDGRVDG